MIPAPLKSWCVQLSYLVRRAQMTQPMFYHLLVEFQERKQLFRIQDKGIRAPLIWRATFSINKRLRGKKSCAFNKKKLRKLKNKRSRRACWLKREKNTQPKRKAAKKTQKLVRSSSSICHFSKSCKPRSARSSKSTLATLANTSLTFQTQTQLLLRVLSAWRIWWVEEKQVLTKPPLVKGMKSKSNACRGRKCPSLRWWHGLKVATTWLLARCPAIRTVKAMNSLNLKQRLNAGWHALIAKLTSTTLREVFANLKQHKFVWEELLQTRYKHSSNSNKIKFNAEICDQHRAMMQKFGRVCFRS